MTLLVVGRTVLLYGLGLALFRLMGKRTLGDMSPFDFVVVITMAEIIGSPLADPALRLVPAVVAVGLLAALQIGLAEWSVRSDTVRRLLEGVPVVVVRDGRLLAGNLARARLSRAELAERLRESGVTEVARVALACIENDGNLSVQLARSAQPLTVGDLAGAGGEPARVPAGLVRALLRHCGVTRAGQVVDVRLTPDGQVWVVRRPSGARGGRRPGPPRPGPGGSAGVGGRRR